MGKWSLPAAYILLSNCCVSIVFHQLYTGLSDRVLILQTASKRTLLKLSYSLNSGLLFFLTVLT